MSIKDVYQILEARFWSKVDFDAHDETRCWPWLGLKNKKGYARFSFYDILGKRYVTYSHRIAYELEIGTIPIDENTGKPYGLDHRCHSPKECEGGVLCPHRACCNPYHLAPATAKENRSVLRSNHPNKNKEYCPKGHFYSEENTYQQGNKRSCIMCRKEHSRNSYIRKIAL